MGMLQGMFNWVSGIRKSPIDKISEDELDAKYTAMNLLRSSWEQKLKKMEDAYRKAVSIEENAQRAPFARKLSIQQGANIAGQIKSLLGALGTIDKCCAVVGQVKSLKQYYSDMCSTSKLPKGISMEEFTKYVRSLGGAMASERQKMDDILGMFDTLADAMSAANGAGGDIEKLTDELTKHYEEYNTKQASNDTAGVEEARRKIAATQAELDKKMGVADMA